MFKAVVLLISMFYKKSPPPLEGGNLVAPGTKPGLSNRNGHFLSELTPLGLVVQGVEWAGRCFRIDRQGGYVMPPPLGKGKAMAGVSRFQIAILRFEIGVLSGPVGNPDSNPHDRR